MHRPDRSALDQLNGLPIVLRFGMALDAQLGDDLRARGGFLRQTTRLEERVAQRLLAIHVFSRPHCRHRDGGVHVIRSGDIAGLEIAGFLGEQFAPVPEVESLGELLPHGPAPHLVDVHDRMQPHPRVLGQEPDVGGGHPGAADGDVIEEAAPLPPGGGRESRGRHDLQKGTARQVVHHTDLPLAYRAQTLARSRLVRESSMRIQYRARKVGVPIAFVLGFAAS